MRLGLLLTLVVSVACASPAVTAPTPARPRPIRLPPTELTPREQRTHLLNRAAFGPSPEDEAAVDQVGLAAWLDAQLADGHDPAIEHRLSGFKSLHLTVAQALEQYQPPKALLREQGVDPTSVDDPEAMKAELRAVAKAHPDELPRQLLVEATQAKLIRAIQSRRQLEEVLVDFWFNHFNVSAEKGRVRWMVTAYERDAIRPFVFGRFRDLLGATAHHPAMLFYLDNFQSVRDGFELPKPKRRELTDSEEAARAKLPRGLNENYARELLELHTLGVEAGYSQSDVREAARALTGWSIELKEKHPTFGAFVFRARAHDEGEKRIFGLTLPAGGGVDDGEKLLDFLARHPATAKHLAFKLCQRFVSDTPPTALVERIAARFIETDGDLRLVTRAIFESPELWSRASFRSKTKTPLEFVTSAVRATGTLDEVYPPLALALDSMGQPLYRCTPPTGFAEPATSWVSAGALVTRINFGMALASGKVRGVLVELPPATPDPSSTVEAVAERLLGTPLTPKTKETVLNALVAKEKDGEVRPLSPAMVAGLLIGSPEFQHQ